MPSSNLHHHQQVQSKNFYFLTAGTLLCTVIAIYLLFFAQTPIPQNSILPSSSISSSSQKTRELVEINDEDQQKQIQRRIKNLRIQNKDNLKPENLMQISTTRLIKGVVNEDDQQQQQGSRFINKENELQMTGRRKRRDNNNNNMKSNDDETTSKDGSGEKDDETQAPSPPPLTDSPANDEKQEQQQPHQTSSSSTFESNQIPKINPQKDDLPSYDKQMKERIRRGQKILQNLPQLPVLDEKETGKVERISDETIASWTKTTSTPEKKKTDDENASDARIKFVQTVSGMMELFPAATTSNSSSTQEDDEDVNNNNNRNEDLSFRTTHYMYARPWLRWKLANEFTENNQQNQQQQPARFACLYAGFTRDFELMLRTCTKSKKRCMSKKIRRTYGYQWDRIIQPLDCDIFMSTWHLHGAGRYFTTTYDEKALVKPVSLWQQRLHEKLAAIHVHNYIPYGQLWNASHRFPRTFPQINTGQETKEESFARVLDQTKMFKTVNSENKYMRMNDYSQSFKHYCSVLLTFSYETWAKGSYDVYLRLRTDLRAVRQITPGAYISFSSSKQNSNNNNQDKDQAKNEDSTSSSSTTLLKRHVVLELCPAAKYGRGLPGVQSASPAAPNAKSSTNDNDNDEKSVQAEDNGGGGQGNAVNGDGTAAQNKNVVVETEKHSCEKHYWTAATTFPGSRNYNRNFDDIFFNVYQKSSASLQTVGINSFDIADFAYIGSPEIISYFGGHLWNMCVQPSFQKIPSFYPKIVNDFANVAPYGFSEYNLMMWRMILDGGYTKDTLFYLVRVSRASMPMVTTRGRK